MHPSPSQSALAYEKKAFRQVPRGRPRRFNPNAAIIHGVMSALASASGRRLVADFRKQPPRNCRLGKLERDVPTVSDPIGADLDQFLTQRG